MFPYCSPMFPCCSRAMRTGSPRGECANNRQFGFAKVKVINVRSDRSILPDCRSVSGLRFSDSPTKRQFGTKRSPLLATHPVRGQFGGAWHYEKQVMLDQLGRPANVRTRTCAEP